MSQSIAQKHASALHRQGWTCPVCHGDITPGMRIILRLDQLAHADCQFTYVAPNHDGTPHLTESAGSASM